MTQVNPRMNIGLQYIRNTSEIHSEVTYTSTLPLNQEGIISTQFSSQVFFSVSSGSSSSPHHLQVFFIFNSSSYSIHLHLQVIFIVKSSSSSLDHHLIWSITGSSSILDHYLIQIITRSSSSMDHHLIWIITGSSSSSLLPLSQSNGAISSFFSSQEVLQSHPFFMLVVGLAFMQVFIIAYI